MTNFRRLARLDRIIKQFEKEKKEIRQQYFDEVAAKHAFSPNLLPTKTIAIPNEFWIKTSISIVDFCVSRFPDYDLIAQEQDIQGYNTILVLRKKAEVVPDVFEDDRVKVSKTVVENTPEIDWVTLEAEFPSIFQRIAREVTHYEINDAELSKVVEEQPEMLEHLKRHLISKPASAKLYVRAKKESN
jgi:hypothetical protein